MVFRSSSAKQYLPLFCIGKCVLWMSKQCSPWDWTNICVIYKGVNIIFCVETLHIFVCCQSPSSVELLAVFSPFFLNTCMCVDDIPGDNIGSSALLNRWLSAMLRLARLALCLWDTWWGVQIKTLSKVIAENTQMCADFNAPLKRSTLARQSLLISAAA